MAKSKQKEFLKLYEPVHERFEGFCRARVYGNMEARDLINETLLVAFEKFDTLKSEKAFLSFLFTICVRILSNNYHKKSEAYLKNGDTALVIEDSSAKTQMDAEIHFLYKALDQLNEAQRESIILFEISGFSIKEIAEIQEASISAVKQRLKRGREKLLEIMTFESSLKTGRLSMDKMEKLSTLFEKARNMESSIPYTEVADRFNVSVGGTTTTLASRLFSNWLIKGVFFVLVGAMIGTGLGAVFSDSSEGTNTEVRQAAQVNVDKLEVDQEIGDVKSLMSVSTEKRIVRKEVSEDSELSFVAVEDATVEVLKESENGEELVESEDNLLEDMSSLSSNVRHRIETSLRNDDNLRLPVFTKAEIRKNNKLKRRVVGENAAYYPSSFSMGEYEVFGEVYKFDGSFFMKTSEVTNLEYRVFLYDLIIQGRKDEFKKAVPRTSGWIEIGGAELDYLAENYFTDEEFNDYPVVNVSRDAAEMYCKWLTKEVRSLYKDKNIKFAGYFKIPTKKQWECAATTKGKYETFPWNSSVVVNAEGNFEANFDFASFTGEFSPKVKGQEGAKDARTTGGYMMGNEKMTVPVFSYNPSETGLYNLSGNVAEMVSNNGFPGTKGGGWMNSEDEIKLNAPDPYEGVITPHPNIGFRIVRVFEEW